MSNRNINRIEITQYINRINPILCSFVLIYCIFHKGFENFLELKHSRVSEKGLYKWKFSILVCVMRFEPTNIVHSDLFRRYRILNLVSFFLSTRNISDKVTPPTGLERSTWRNKFYQGIFRNTDEIYLISTCELKTFKISFNRVLGEIIIHQNLYWELLWNNSNLHKKQLLYIIYLSRVF